MVTKQLRHPPPWFVHAAWRVHRAMYRLDVYAARRSTETPVVVIEPRDGTG